MTISLPTQPRTYDCVSFGILLSKPDRPSIDTFIEALRTYGAYYFDRTCAIYMDANSEELKCLINEFKILDGKIQTVLNDDDLDAVMYAVNLESASRKKGCSIEDRTACSAQAEEIYSKIEQKMRLLNPPQRELFEAGWPKELVDQLLGLTKLPLHQSIAERNKEIIARVLAGYENGTPKEEMYRRLGPEYKLEKNSIRSIVTKALGPSGRTGKPPAKTGKSSNKAVKPSQKTAPNKTALCIMNRVGGWGGRTEKAKSEAD